MLCEDLLRQRCVCAAIVGESSKAEERVHRPQPSMQTCEHLHHMQKCILRTANVQRYRLTDEHLSNTHNNISPPSKLGIMLEKPPLISWTVSRATKFIQNFGHCWFP